MMKRQSKLRVSAVALACAVVVGTAGPGSVSGQGGSGAVPPPSEAADSEGFRFIGGNPDQGLAAFNQLNCIQCHTVRDVPVAAPEGKRRLNLELAGEVRFVKSYRDLVTAITNPRHVMNEQHRAILGGGEVSGEIEPFMPNLIDHMSVRQLIDVVAFLDGVYRRSLADYAKSEEDGGAD